jgi:UDP-N-acetylglucosamine acyltransferase
MATNISALADVHPRAEIGDDVEIGPFCTVGPQVRLGRGCKLLAQVTILGHVTIGEENKFYPGAVIGGEPQDLSYCGSDTQVVIGDGNVFREAVTVNRATEKENGVTSIGNDCFLMACCHVAHDCAIGDRVVMANGTLLAGHVRIDNHATLSGNVGVHQFTTIGSYSFIGGLSRVLHDVPPYMLMEGNPCRPRCVNLVALRRNNFPRETIEALSEAHRLLFRAKVGLDQACEILRSQGHLVPPVNHLLSFVQEQQEGRFGRARERRKAA